MLKIVIQDYIPKVFEDHFLGERESRPDIVVIWQESGAYGCYEWAIPTAIVIAFSKELFGGFLGEAGKDLYAQLRSWLITTISKGKDIPIKTLSTSDEKMNSENSQSKGISFEFYLKDTRKLKFLFDTRLSQEQIEKANFSALDLIYDYCINSPNDLLTKAIGKLGFDAGYGVFGFFDLNTNEWHFTDIRQEAIRTGKIRLATPSKPEPQPKKN